MGMKLGVLTPGRMLRHLIRKTSLRPLSVLRAGRYQRNAKLGAGAGHSPFTSFQM